MVFENMDGHALLALGVPLELAMRQRLREVAHALCMLSMFMLIPTFGAALLSGIDLYGAGPAGPTLYSSDGTGRAWLLFLGDVIAWIVLAQFEPDESRPQDTPRPQDARTARVIDQDFRTRSPRSATTIWLVIGASVALVVLWKWLWYG